MKKQVFNQAFLPDMAEKGIQRLTDHVNNFWINVLLLHACSSEKIPISSMGGESLMFQNYKSLNENEEHSKKSFFLRRPIHVCTAYAKSQTILP